MWYAVPIRFHHSKLRWCKLHLIVYRSFNQTFFFVLRQRHYSLKLCGAVRCAMHWMKHINYTFILRIATINFPTQFHSIVSYFSFFFQWKPPQITFIAFAVICCYIWTISWAFIDALIHSCSLLWVSCLCILDYV